MLAYVIIIDIAAALIQHVEAIATAIGRPIQTCTCSHKMAHGYVYHLYFGFLIFTFHCVEIVLEL